MSIDLLAPVPIVATVDNSIDTVEFTNTGTPAITGLTNKLTPFTFSLSTLDVGVIVSDDTITWHYGDGNVGVGNNSTHIYKWPGEYTVKVTFIDSSGEAKRSSLSQKIKVYNYFNDVVWWDTPGINGCFLDPIIAGRPSDAFTIHRTGSWQSYEAHKDSSYTVNLYCSGSDSVPLTQETYFNSKYIHYQQTWRYITDPSDRLPVNSVVTSNNRVYLKKSGKKFIHTTEEDVDGVFVGTRGKSTVHFMDDSPTNLNGRMVPVFLYASLDMSRHADTYDNTLSIVNGDYRDVGISYFEHHRSVLPVKVLYNAPTKLLYTSNGIKQFGISQLKLQGTSIPITISLADDEDNIITGTFPELSADFDGFDRYYVNPKLIPGDRTTYNIPEIRVWKRNDIPIDTPGSFSGALSTCSDTGCTGTVKLSSAVKITDPSYFTFPEITNVYVADVKSNELFNYRIQYRFPNRYSFFHKQTLSYNLPGIRKTSRNITTPGLSSILGIAINGRGEAWVADGDVDKIMRIDACGETTYTVSTSAYIPNSDNTSPVGIAVDGDSNFYFSCADTVSAFKVQGSAPNKNEPPPLLASLVPDVSNRVFRGNNTVQPGPIETTMDNKVVVGYTHSLSTFMCVYSKTGEFISRHTLPEASHPVDILCDRQLTTWVLGAGAEKTTGSLTHLDKNGTILHTMSGIQMPGALAMDASGNVWFSYGANRLRKVSGKTHRVMYDGEIGSRIEPPYDFISAIEGLASDLDGNILAIHNLDKKLHFIQSDDPFTRSVVDIPSKSTDNRVQAYGDWTGGRWINKFGRATTTEARNRTVEGESPTFKLLPVEGCETIAKINEDFDSTEAITSYMTQPVVRDSTSWQVDMVQSIVGDYYSYPWEFGKLIYEKIANHVMNISDIHTSNIRTVYSMAQSVGYDLDDYNYTFPGKMGRVMDLLSIKHKKLFGSRNKFDLDFDYRGHPGNENYATNLGEELDIKTYYVTAGVAIVANELYGNVKTKVMPLVIHGDTTDKHYSTKHQGLTSYPISGYQPEWGWGLSYETHMSRYYSFYEYIPGTSDEHIEKIIDWDNWYTTLKETNSSYEAWSDSNGIIDNILTVTLKTGLGLVNDCVKGDPPECIHDLKVRKGVYLTWSHSKYDRETTNYYRVLRSYDNKAYSVVGTVKRFSKQDDQPLEFHDKPLQCVEVWYRIEAVNDYGVKYCENPETVSIYSEDYKSVDIKFFAGPPTPTPTPYPIVTPTPLPTGPSVMWRKPRAVYIREPGKGKLYIDRPVNSDSTHDIYIDIGIEYLDVDDASATPDDVYDITSGIYKLPAGKQSIEIPVQSYGDYNTLEKSEVFLVKILDVYTEYNVPVTIKGYDFSAVTIMPGPESVPIPTPTPTDHWEQFYLAVTPTPTDSYVQYYLAITPTPTGMVEEWVACTPTPTPTGMGEQLEMCYPTPTPTPTPTYGTPCDVDTDTEESELL